MKSIVNDFEKDENNSNCGGHHASFDAAATLERVFNLPGVSGPETSTRGGGNPAYSEYEEFSH